MAGFSQLYEKYVGQVYRFLLGLSGDKSVAEELTQETFYQAFLHIGQFANRCSVSTWLCQIGKNAYFKELKRRKKTVFLEDMSAEDAERQSKSYIQGPEDIFLENERTRWLRAHLSQLEEPYRTVLILRVYGETEYKELARLYGKSESWARVTYFRAKEQLALLLKEEK